MIKLINDNFQNYKRYAIPRAQLVIADIPYNIGTNFYGSNPTWYIGGNSKNGESKKSDAYRRCKMGRKSREKGKRGEREFAKKLREYGYSARRGQQYSGANGDADVIGLPGIHIEVKRTERLSLYDAIAQASADSLPDEKPIIAHRKNNCPWVIIQPLEDWIEIYREWEAGR